MASKQWPALVIEAPALDDSAEMVPAILDGCSPVAIEDLADIPLPPGGLWDPTFPPIPEPPPTPLHWRVFFASADDRARAIAALTDERPHLTLTAFDVDDEDWAARTQQSLTAVAAGRFIVAPPWDIPSPVPSGQTVVIIEPSMGFGTGHHATTRLCLRLLSDEPVAGKTVLDVGTGSGVLAMAAALAGATAVLGLDIDQDAIDSAITSARMNTLPPVVRFEVGDFRAAPPPAADLVLANLTGGILRTTAADLGSLVTPGGTLILSGFDLSEVDAVRAAFHQHRETTRLEEDGWIALRLT